MDRRKFVTLATATAAAVANGGFGRSRRAFAQSSINIDLMNSAMAQHSNANANFFYNSGTVDDINAMASANLTIGGHFSSIGIDSAFQPIFAGLTPAQVNMANFDPTPALSWMQQYAPDMTIGDLNAITSAAISNSSVLPTALSNLQNYGLSSAITSAGLILERRAAALTPPDQMSKLNRTHRPIIRSAIYNSELQKPHLKRAQWHSQEPGRWLRIVPSLGTLPTLSNCQADTLMQLDFGATLVIVAIACTADTGPGTLVCTPVVTVITSVIAVAWAGVHSALCGL
jgi:hypothetical protein